VIPHTEESIRNKNLSMDHQQQHNEVTLPRRQNKVKHTYEEMMSFNFEKDFKLISNRLDRLDRLKSKQLKLKDGQKQIGILKIGCDFD
jgi:hypothetical protein